jgi:hypothetical protein
MYVGNDLIFDMNNFKGNIEKAIIKIKQTLAWRKDFQVDQIKHAFDEESDLSRQQHDQLHDVKEDHGNQPTQPNRL